MNQEEDKKAKVQFEEYTANASQDDIHKIEANIGSMKHGRLAKVWDQVMALWEMVKDPTAAWGSKAIAIGALLYAISPIDAIPDFVPFLGLTDDVAVIATAVAALGVALKKYRKE